MNKETCMCGCGREVQKSQMQLVRTQWKMGAVSRPGRNAWWVHRDCKSAFEAELMRIHAVEAVVRRWQDHGFLARLARAAQIFDLQLEIHTRRKGQERARTIAWTAVRLFLTPAWLRILIERLTFTKKSETESHAPTDS